MSIALVAFLALIAIAAAGETYFSLQVKFVTVTDLQDGDVQLKGKGVRMGVFSVLAKIFIFRGPLTFFGRYESFLCQQIPNDYIILIISR